MDLSSVRMQSNKEMRESLKRMQEECKAYWKNKKGPRIKLMEGESAPFSHPFGDYVETTSFQRLQFRADKMQYNNPNYLTVNPLQDNWFELKKKYDNINKWRFIIENIYKIPEENFYEFYSLYSKYRHSLLECKKYASLLIKGREQFYKESGRTMSDNLMKLEEKKLFYF